MALVTGAVGLATVVLVVVVGHHHLYLLIVLHRWPDENDVRIRRREMEHRRERRRAATVRAPRRLRPAGHAPVASARSVAALAVSASVLLTAGFIAAFTSGDRQHELPRVELDPASAPPRIGREIPPASSNQVDGATTGAATS